MTTPPTAAPSDQPAISLAEQIDAESLVDSLINAVIASEEHTASETKRDMVYRIRKRVIDSLRQLEGVRIDAERYPDGRRKGRSPLTKDTIAARLAGEPPAPQGQWREGGIDLHCHNGWFTVSIERGGKFIPVIRTFHGGITSHAVWPLGIDAAIDRAREGK